MVKEDVDGGGPDEEDDADDADLGQFHHLVSLQFRKARSFLLFTRVGQSSFMEQSQLVSSEFETSSIRTIGCPAATP